MRNCGSLPEPCAILLHLSISEPSPHLFQPTPCSHPIPNHQDIYFYSFSFSSHFLPSQVVIYLPYSLSFLFFKNSFPSLIDQLYSTLPPPHSATFPSHQIPVFAGMGRRGIKLEISGAKADWNGTFPLLQPSSRTFLRSVWDTAGVAKEVGEGHKGWGEVGVGCKKKKTCSNSKNKYIFWCINPIMCDNQRKRLV